MREEERRKEEEELKLQENERKDSLSQLRSNLFRYLQEQRDKFDAEFALKVEKAKSTLMEVFEKEGI